MTPLADPAYLPFKLDPVARRVLMVRLDAAQRREAAFLDERALPARADGAWLPVDALLAGGTDAAPPAHAIFHIGHCGSTLLSRVLDSWPPLLGLREPLPLRTLAEAWPHLAAVDSRFSPGEAPLLLQMLWRLWSRPLSGTERVLVKATSNCNGLAAPLLERFPALRAVLLDMPLRPYLATLLKSPDATRDAASAAGERLRDLQARGFARGVFLHALSLPQQCAMGWLAEQVRFAALAQDHGGRVLRVDFEALLAQPEAELLRIATHVQQDPAGVARALQSPAWSRYSKAQAHGYGRDDRAHDLALAAARHGAEIEVGVRWCRAQMASDSALANAVGARAGDAMA